MISLFKLFLPDSYLVDCMFLKSCPYLLDCQICWQIIIHSILLQFLYFCGIHWDFSFTISYFSYLGSLFLVSLARYLSTWFALSKNQLLVLLTFSIVSSNLCFISSLILLIPFFWWLWVLFVLFLILFGGGEVWRPI